jgi:hypothetical protein
VSGIPEWIVPTGGIGSILASLIAGFAKGFLWTRPQVDKLIASRDAEIERLDKERLEWKEMALESIHVLRGTNTTMDSVLAGQQAMRGLLEALRSKAEAN